MMKDGLWIATFTKESILRLVPKSKKSAVRDAWEDTDGVWIMLNEGWSADNMDSDCRTIHEGGEDCTYQETVKQLKYQIAGIRKV